MLRRAPRTGDMALDMIFDASKSNRRLSWAVAKVGSQSGSQHAQTLSHVRRCPATIAAGEGHTGRREATPGGRRELIWEQEAAGSNPAIPRGSGYFPNLESIA